MHLLRFIKKIKVRGLLLVILAAVLCCFFTGCSSIDRLVEEDGLFYDLLTKEDSDEEDYASEDSDEEDYASKDSDEGDAEDSVANNFDEGGAEKSEENDSADTDANIDENEEAVPVFSMEVLSEIESRMKSDSKNKSEGSAGTEKSSDNDSDTASQEPSDEEIRLATDGMYRYYYTTLNEKDRASYRDIYKILLGHETDVKMKSKSSDNLDRVFQLVMNDHPEIFYVKGYNMKKYTQGEKVVGIEFSGTYEKSKDEALKYQEKIDDYADRCLDGVPMGGSDYDKVKYVYEYIVDRTQYNLNARDNQNLISVCCYGQSVCQGYAKTTQYLLNKLGIPCILVTGTANGGESHAWNMAYVDGIWCNIDTTWGDASYKTNSPEAEPGINYDYLCANDDLMKKSHLADRKSKLPECTSRDNYYYVKEGTYFTNLEEDSKEKLKQLFEDYYARGADRLVVKCSNIHVYYDMLDYLIKKEHIFELQHAKDGKVSYARLEDSNAILFYL